MFKKDYKDKKNIYKNDDAGWDLGGPTPVFINISSIIKPKKLCIIGCGKGYDAVMFAKNNLSVYENLSFHFFKLPLIDRFVPLEVKKFLLAWSFITNFTCFCCCFSEIYSF